MILKAPVKKRITDLNAVLADWDEGFLPDGAVKYFSVGYLKKNGEFVYIKRAVRSGLKANMKLHDLKAAQPVSIDGSKVGHVHPIWIHAIVLYRGNIVYNLMNTSNE